MLNLKAVAKRLVRSAVSAAGYTLTPKGNAYFDADVIIKAAAAAGCSVPDYLDRFSVGGLGKRRDEIMEKLIVSGAVKPCEAIVEIGAGSGMYLERFVELCRPARYEVYEPNRGWKRYLRDTFRSRANLLLHDADGRTLNQTADESADLVTAHGVFVYLPVVVSLEYLREAVRVCRVGGFLIFDCFTSDTFGLDEILSFREHSGGYDFPVVINAAVIDAFCSRFCLKRAASFDMTYHAAKNSYFVLQKGKPG